MPDWSEKVDVIHRAVAKNWPTYGTEDLHFLSLALCGEAGELANLVKKEWRGDVDDENRVRWKNKVASELADIRIYLELLAKAAGIDLDEAVETKIEELLVRWPHAAEAVAKISK